MAQTEATKQALARDSQICQWCLYKFNRVRHIFNDIVPGYHPRYAGGHHLLGRSRVDDARAIVALCAECHSNQENLNKPSKAELAEMMYKIYKIDLVELYPECFKASETAWRKS